MSQIHLDNPVAWALNAFRDGRNEQYEKFESYIQGDQPLAFATPKFESAFGKLFREFAYNRCEMAVDAHTDRLQLKGFNAKGGAVSNDAMALWDDNRMDVRENHLYRDALGLGDGYIIVEKHHITGRVMFWVNQPQHIRVHWSDEQPDMIDLAAKVWWDDEKYCYLTIYKPGIVEKYVSLQKSPSGMPRSDKAFTRREVQGEPWPLHLDVPDVVPVFHFANNGRTSAYGVSELRSVLPLQNAINKTITDMMVAMELVSFPQRVLMGVDVPTTQQEMDLIKAFESGMTRLWTMDDPQAKIGEFSAVNIAQFIAVAEYFDKSVSRVTKIPVHWLGMTAEIESGRARRIAEAAFVSKIEDRQKAFGFTMSEAVRYGLALNGKAVEHGELQVEWESAESVTDEDELDQMLTKKSLGLPLETILREGGKTEKEITDIMAEKQRAVDDAAMMFSRGFGQDAA